MACRVITSTFQSICHRSYSSARLIHSTLSHHRSSIGVRSFNYLGTLATRSRTFRFSITNSYRTSFRKQLTEPALLQTRSTLIRACNRHNCTIQGSARRSSRPSTFLIATSLAGTSETLNALVKRIGMATRATTTSSKRMNWRRFEGCRVTTARIASARRGGESFEVLS